MTFWLDSLALATAVLSAIALYACSPHCPRSMRLQRPRAMRIAALALAALSLAAWIQVAGSGVGLCTMLACWMLSLMLLPYLVVLGAKRGATARENANVD